MVGSAFGWGGESGGGRGIGRGCFASDDGQGAYGAAFGYQVGHEEVAGFGEVGQEGSGQAFFV